MDMMSLRRRVLVNQNKLVTATGNPITFNTPLTKPLKECVVRFAPQQSGSGTPSPENVRKIVGKNGITVWQSNKGVFHNLPSAYQEVEYIEGTGTQKINTGIVFNDSDFNVSCRFVLPEYYGTSEYPVISIWIGVRNYWNCFVRGSSNRRMSVYTATHHQPTREVNEGEINDISLNRTDTTWTFTHNEETINWTYSPTTSNDTTLKVFTRGDSNAASRIRVYSLTVEIEGELVGDFVPCYRKSDNVAGLYDLVTKTFFTNYADDTNFVVGEDIVGVETSVSFDDAPQDIDPPEVAGTIYGGYVDTSKGELVAEYQLFDCADHLTTASDIEMVNGNLCRIRGSKFIDTGTLSDGIAEKFETFGGSWSQMTTATGEKIMASGYVGFSSSNFGYTTKDEWFEYLTQNHIKFCAKLSESIHYSLTPQSIATLRGNNVMWSDANGDITVRYWTR